jgi:hypothetical protein
MSDNNVSPQATPAVMETESGAPPPQAAPPPQQVPNLSGLNQPAQPSVMETESGAPPQAAAPSASNAGDQETYNKYRTATQNVADLVNKPAPTLPPNRHPILAAMVNGLLAGLGSAGTALATRGKEGGPEEVQQIRQNDQNQKNKQLEILQSTRNSQIQQQRMVAEANFNLWNTSKLLMTTPDDIEMSHLKVANEKQTLAGGEAAQRGQYGGQTAAEFNAGMSDKTPLFPAQPAQTGQTGQTGQSAPPAPPALTKMQTFVTSNAQHALTAATTAHISDSDPFVQNLNKVMAPGSGASASDITAAVTGLQNQITQQAKARTDAANAPLGDEAAASNARNLRRYQVLNPNAKSLPSEYQVNPNSTPKEQKEIDDSMQKVENAQGTQTQRDILNQMRKDAAGNSGTGSDLEGPAYLASLSVSDRNQVQAIGEGRQEGPNLRTKAGQQLSAKVTQAYPASAEHPGYDASRAPSYIGTRKDFTHGKTSQGINSFNTVLDHLGRMDDHLTDAGKHGSLGVPGKVQAGLNINAGPDIQAMRADLDPIATEMAKAYANGTLAEGEMKGYMDRLDPTAAGQTVSKMRIAIKEYTNLLKGKLEAYQNQWDNGMPNGVVAPLTIMSERSRKVFNHINGIADTSGTQSPAAAPQNGGFDWTQHPAIKQ